MKLGIAGLGWWGGTLVDAVEGSPNLKFVAAYTRSRSQQDQDIAAKHHLKLVDSYEAMLADPEVEGVVLATPPPGHADQIVRQPKQASTCSAKSPSSCRKPMPTAPSRP